MRALYSQGKGRRKKRFLNKSMPNGEQPTTQQPSVQSQLQKPGKSKWLVVLLVIIGIIVIIGVLGLVSVKGTPQYSLYKMAEAVKKKDYTTFSKYFNVDSVVDDLLDKALEEAKKNMLQQAEESSEDTKAAQEYFEFLAVEMRTQMKEQAKAEIKKSVEEGRFYEDYKEASMISIFLNTKFQVKGTEADVILVNREKNQSLPLKMRKKNGYWEIYKIDIDISELQKFM